MQVVGPRLHYRPCSRNGGERKRAAPISTLLRSRVGRVSMQRAQQLSDSTRFCDGRVKHRDAWLNHPRATLEGRTDVETSANKAIREVR
jgi:hypothetical protein